MHTLVAYLQLQNAVRIEIPFLKAGKEHTAILWQLRNDMH